MAHRTALRLVITGVASALAIFVLGTLSPLVTSWLTPLLAAGVAGGAYGFVKLAEEKLDEYYN